MYHPSARSGTDSLDFIEIYNTEPFDWDISGFRICGATDYTFPSNTTLGATSFLVVAQCPDATTNVYGITNVTGPLEGNLPNDRGLVRLRNDFGMIALEVEYSDDHPWPVAADGAGHSLVLRYPDYGEGSVEAWAASAEVGGSPGVPDPTNGYAPGGVVINEFLAHTDLPAVDFIELFNTGTQTVDISGCALSDSPDTNKFTIPPATVIPPRGFA